MQFIDGYHSSVLALLSARETDPFSPGPEFAARHAALIEDMLERWHADDQSSLPTPGQAMTMIDGARPTSQLRQGA